MARGGPTRGGLGNNKARQAFAGWLFIAPVVVLLGLFLLASLSIIAANLVTDLAYTWLDPRIRYE